MNENLDRGHLPDTDAVALSSQKVSREATVFPYGPGSISFGSDPKSRQKSASDPPFTDANAPGRRIHISLVLPSPSSRGITGNESVRLPGATQTVAGSIPRGAETSSPPTHSLLAALCLAANDAKFR